MKSHREILFAFVLDRISSEPIHTRIPVLRALAEYSGNPVDSERLQRIADQLEAADRLCREFKFSPVPQTKPNPKK